MWFKYNKIISIDNRGETIIEFKSCSIKAIEMNKFVLLSGNPKDILDDLKYNIVGLDHDQMYIRFLNNWFFY